MTHQNLILPAYYYKESRYNLTEHLDNLVADLKPTQIRIWEPLRGHYPNFSIVKLPSKLKDVKDIEIGEFINQMKSLETNTLEIDDHIAIWPYVCIGIGVICLVIAFGLFCYCKCYPKFQNYQKVRRERKFRSHDVNKLKVQMLKPSALRDTSKENNAIRRGSSDSRPIYPTLDLATATV